MTNNIWSWVWDYTWDLEENGYDDVAEKIDMLSSYACDGDVSSTELIVPELLNHARTTHNTWLEVFVRHWRLQAYIRTSEDPRPLIPEALELLVYASGEGTNQCPQRICITDDLNAIYASVDATGFAPERLAMVDEVMAELPVERDCYSCMAFAKCGALVDLGRPKEAIEAFEKAKQVSCQVRDDIRGSEYFRTEAKIIARALLQTGDAKGAQKLLAKCEPMTSYISCEVNVLRAAAFLVEGATPLAKKYFDLSMEVDDKDVHVNRLVENLPKFCAAGLIADEAAFAERLVTIAETMNERGRVGEAFDGAFATFSMNIKQKDPNLALRAITAMEFTLPSLNRDAAHQVLTMAQKRVA